DRGNKPDYRKLHGGFAQCKTLVVDGKIYRPGDDRNAGKRDADSSRNHGQKRRYGKNLRDGHDVRARAARRLIHPKKSNRRKNPSERHDEQSHLPAVTRADEPSDFLSKSAAKEHSHREDRLR